jgi:hypothetical protein
MCTIGRLCALLRIFELKLYPGIPRRCVVTVVFRNRGANGKYNIFLRLYGLYVNHTVGR